METMTSNETILAVKLGTALKQTFTELEELKKEKELLNEELFLNSRLVETLKEENSALRNRQEGLEEQILEVNERNKRTYTQESLNAHIDEHRQSFKRAQAKVAHVLKKTLHELKRVKKENITLASLQEALNYSMEENQSLACQKNDILQQLFAVELEVQEHKKQKEEDLKRLKTEFQSILKKTREDTLQFIQRKLEGEKDGLHEELNIAQKKLQDIHQQSREQAKLIAALKDLLEKKESALIQKKQQEELLIKERDETKHSLQSELKEWQDKYYNAQVRLNKSEASLFEFQTLKLEYEKMHSLFANIKTVIGGSFGQHLPPSAKALLPSSEDDLFSLPPPLAKSKEELF